MSVLQEMLAHPARWRVTEDAQPRVQDVELAQPSSTWDPEKFGEQQIRGLIQQVFVPESSQQVVFCASDETTQTASVCAQVSRAMPAQLQGSVCAVEACVSGAMETRLTVSGARVAWFRAGKTRKDFIRLADKLWLVPRSWLLGHSAEGLSLEEVRARLGRLREEFDYTLIHAPAVGMDRDAVMLGQMCDGVVLVLDAHTTRRAAARRATAMLQVANARLVGTVLNQRTFPIPERIYRKL